MLGCSCSLRSHLQFANLALRKAAGVVVWALLWVLWFWLLRRLWCLWWLVHVCLVTERSVEVYTGRRRWYLALCLEQPRLQVDDVVAQLVVFRLEGLVELA